MKFTRNLQAAIQQAKEYIRVAQQRLKAYADKSRVDKSFNLGEKVLLSTKNLKLKNDDRTAARATLLPKFVGPYKIIELVGKVAYRLELLDSTKIHPVFHVSLLYPYKDPERFPGAVRQATPLDWLEGDPTFEVDLIADHRVLFSGGKRSVTYLIKWNGFSEVHDTWEPEKSLLTHIPEMVLRYNRHHKVATVYDQADHRCVRSGQPRTSVKSATRRTLGVPPLEASVPSTKQPRKQKGARNPAAWAGDRPEGTAQAPPVAPPARRVQFEPETEPQPRSDWPPASEDQARKSGRKRSVPLRLQTISYFSVLLEDKKEYVYLWMLLWQALLQEPLHQQRDRCLLTWRKFTRDTSAQPLQGA